VVFHRPGSAPLVSSLVSSYDAWVCG